MANFEIQNYKGEVITASISQEELTQLIENTAEFNVFQAGEGLVEEFKAGLENGTYTNLDNIRIYKPIAQ
jgi:hypothetical protein